MLQNRERKKNELETSFSFPENYRLKNLNIPKTKITDIHFFCFLLKIESLVFTPKVNFIYEFGTLF